MPFWSCMDSIIGKFIPPCFSGLYTIAFGMCIFTPNFGGSTWYIGVFRRLHCFLSNMVIGIEYVTPLGRILVISIRYDSSKVSLASGWGDY